MDGHEISFGPFRLIPTQRLLLEGDKPVRLGSRAFEILVALVERAGEVIRKEDLLARVWPRTFVEDSNLKLQVSTLRRALGDGQGGRRYVLTIPGQGYNFVAPVNVESPAATPPPAAIAPARAHNLPLALTRMIGREEAVAALVSRLSRERLVTIVGAGGIGKTTIALAVAEHTIPDYEHGVWMIDLAPVGDPRLVPSAVATVLGLEIRSDNPLPGLAAGLRDKRMLLLLDNCEHVIEAAAVLATEVLSQAPGVTMLATSRELLAIAGEAGYRLGPLTSPLPSPGVTAAEAAAFPAVQLFVERVTANVEDFALTDTNVSLVVEICRRLDGLPLAIEFAAPRVEALGIQGLAARLDDSLPVLNGWRRTATPRHRTMGAVLDWSYQLLKEDEQQFLRALGIFSGTFTVEAAAAVAADSAAGSGDAINRLADLVAKSLVVADVSETIPRFRLLDTTRGYALGKLREASEWQEYAHRHAEYLRDVMRIAEAEWETRTTLEWRASYAQQTDDVRAALNWAFSPAGDTMIDVALTAAAVPLFCELWLLEECRARAERALAALEQADADDDRHRMQLYAAVASSQAYTLVAARDTRAAWNATLRIADALGDTEYQLRALWGIWGTHVNRGEFREGLAVAKRFSGLAATASDANDRLVGDRLTGAALHFLGDQQGAREHIERMLAAYVTPTRRSHALRFQSDQRVTAHMYLARILWLQGFPDQAQKVAEANVLDAERTGHPQSLCNALAGAACPVAFLAGNLEAARRYTTMLLDQTAREVLELWHAHAICFYGELLIRCGDVGMGLQRLELGTEQLVRSSFGQYILAFLSTLAAGFAAAGQVSRAQDVIDNAIAQSEQSEACWYLPELLRVRATITLRTYGSDGAVAAEEGLVRSIDLARSQAALSWELRASMDLARLWRDRGYVSEASTLLSGVHGRFVEGHGTADLQAAKDLLQTL
ncbi:MAG TPA: winged helix-turn-helix domain-containing protein [Acetobacteraceae bacterium]|nr:winged helix-turn-helix domain-containing protein [Acetobacteraceae bacterium]